MKWTTPKLYYTVNCKWMESEWVSFYFMVFAMVSRFFFVQCTLSLIVVNFVRNAKFWFKIFKTYTFSRWYLLCLNKQLFFCFCIDLIGWLHCQCVHFLHTFFPIVSSYHIDYACTWKKIYEGGEKRTRYYKQTSKFSTVATAYCCAIAAINCY